MSILKFLGKAVKSFIPFGSAVSEIIAPGKTPEQIEQGLASLDPIAQYNRTMARPRIALACVYTYLGMTVGNWLLAVSAQIFKVALQPVPIPGALQDFATIAVGAYMGSRGVEKIVSSIFKKRKRKKK